jgi:glycosyltransferase involved in cell wall biosynthesis
MPKQKILLFSDWFYPGFMAGGPIQSSFNLITHLKEYYDFSVVTRNTDYTDSVPYANIKSDMWNVLPNGMSVYYFSAKNLNYTNLQRLTRKEEFDIAYLNSMYSPRFTIMPLFILSKMKKQIILAPRGMLAPSAIAIKSWKKKPFLLWLKNSSIVKDITFHAASVQETEHIKKVFGNNANIKMAPNLPLKMELAPFTERKKEPASAYFISIARVSPEKNLLFALEILQKIKGKVRFDVYGPVYDYPYWEKCKAVINKMPENIVVNYHGPVAKEDTPARIKEAQFLFLPTRGENFGHTILEAMMYGCPAIISDQTPWTGLEAARAGYDLPLNNKPGFVSAVEKALAMNSEEYRRWSEGTRTFALNFIDNPKLLEQSIEIFKN